MSEISHKQAFQWIHRRLDGLLSQEQAAALDEHLRACEGCSAYAAEMEMLPLHLRHEFHVRWDKKPGPSHQVMERVTAQASSLPVTNRFSSGMKWIAGAVALVILGLAINFVISQLQNSSVAASPTPAVNAGDRLIAFAANQNGNFDIYTMHADGADLTNLTNSLANDTNPIWSPDGKYIAFESDRNGFVQIYRMDANGSNVVQLTRDEADHNLPLNRNGTHNPWSPDSRRLLFVQRESGEEMATLYSMDIDGENKIMLANGRISLYDVSWSPDGKHIAYLLNVSPTPDKYVPNLYVVEPDGSNTRELRKLFPTEKQSDFLYTYYWSSNGESIFLPASARESVREAIYQLDLRTNTFLTETETQPIIEDWREGVSLIKDINREGMPFVWERSDGTRNIFEASKAWDTTYDPSIASSSPCSLDFTRSNQNNFAFGVYCPDSKFNLYWTNSDGSMIKQLLDLPTNVDSSGVGDIAWSPDDQYLAFNLTSSGKTEMYVLNVEESLANSSSQPLHIPVSTNKGNGIPSWQPIANEDIAQIPTPQPTPGSSSDGLLAFASNETGNYDIYTIHADGAGRMNLTNDPASDTEPFWSPDSQRIAFASDRDGSWHIYLMDADGSNVTQLTTGEGNYTFDVNGYTPWSPDGSQLIVSHMLSGEHNGKLYVVDITDKTITTLTTEAGQYLFPSWSPDGRHIAFLADTGRAAMDLFVVGSDGNQLAKLTENLSGGEYFLFGEYYWAPDSTSISFATNGGATHTSAVYQAGWDRSLTVIAQTNKTIINWWNGVALELGEGPLTWVRPDGSTSTLELCDSDNQLRGIVRKRSASGDLIFGSKCADRGWTLYWANSDGTVIDEFLNSSIPPEQDIMFNMNWSPDEQYVAFVGSSSVSADSPSTLYILDIEKAREDPSIQPLKLTNSFEPSWQPAP